MSNRLLSHLAHVELVTPTLDGSVRFFEDVMGLTQVGRADSSVYLRCWGDHYHHSLVLTEGEQPALGHAAWRTESAEDLERAVANVEAAGIVGEWREPTLGHGRAYRFAGPGGHVTELFWEVDRYQAPEELRSSYPERPQRPSTRGIAPRQLDHITIASSAIMEHARWHCDTLGFRFMAYNGLDHDPNMVVFAVVTTNEKSHDLGMGIDLSDIPGRIHHLAFWVESPEDLLRAADVLIEAGTPIEFGPGKHGIGEQNYLYFREPGGLRIEINSGGYRNYVPDWQPTEWRPSQGSNTMYRNVAMPDSMMEAFPPAAAGAAPELGAQPAGVAGGIENPWGAPRLG
jgi:catechol 2,3-dioxygenase